EFINTELRADALAYIQNLNLDQIASGPARDALKDIIARDLEKDIRESNYVIQDSCQEIGGQAAGGAVANQLGGDICLSPKRLAEIDSSKAEIVGLVIHEHAHHFGYVDADYSIDRAVFETVSIDQPDWNQTPANGSSGSVPGMKFVPIQPGTFVMGSPASEP